MRSYLAGRLRSFGYAFRGIWTMLRSQRNAWIHALATIGVLAAGWALGISANDWKWLVLALVAVWGAEALNTALEFLADAATPEFHPLVKQAKDVAAGAVLIAAIGAAAIGALVFIPAIISSFES